MSNAISQQGIIPKLVSHADRNVATGRFTQGNQAARGRSSRSRDNLAVFRQCISQADIVSLAENIKERAKGGDLQAAKLILDYVLPRVSEIAMIERKWEQEEDAEQMRESIANPRRLI